MWKQLTGEPVAGKPHTGFGGRGRRSSFPTPIQQVFDGGKRAEVADVKVLHAKLGELTPRVRQMNLQVIDYARNA